MTTSKIHGLKPSEDSTGRTVYCDAEDKDATYFEVKTINFYSTFQFDTLYKAEQLQRAIEIAFEAGKQQTKMDFRQWLAL